MPTASTSTSQVLSEALACGGYIPGYPNDHRLRDVLHAGYVRDPTLKAAHRRSTRDGAPLPAAKGMLLMVTLRT